MQPTPTALIECILNAGGGWDCPPVADALFVLAMRRAARSLARAAVVRQELTELESIRLNGHPCRDKIVARIAELRAEVAV